MVGSIFGWLGLLFAGMPVGFSLIFVALAFLILTNSTGINFAAQQMLGGIDNFTLLAVPFFVLTGHLMNSPVLQKESSTSRSLSLAILRAAWVM